MITQDAVFGAGSRVQADATVVQALEMHQISDISGQRERFFSCLVGNELNLNMDLAIS